MSHRIVPVLLLLFILTGCVVGGSDEEKVTSIIVDMSCLAQFGKEASDKVGTEGFDMNVFRKEMEGKSSDLKAKIKASFTNDAAFTTAFTAISDKDTLKKTVLAKAQTKCQAGNEMVERAFEQFTATIEGK